MVTAVAMDSNGETVSEDTSSPDDSVAVPKEKAEEEPVEQDSQVEEDEKKSRWTTNEGLMVPPNYAPTPASNEKASLRITTRPQEDASVSHDDDSARVSAVSRNNIIIAAPPNLRQTSSTPGAVSVRPLREFEDDSLIDDSVETYSIRTPNSAAAPPEESAPSATQDAALSGEIQAWTVEEEEDVAEDDESSEEDEESLRRSQERLMNSARQLVIDDAVVAEEVRPWRQTHRKMYIMLGIALLVAIGLVVGLSVGLTQSSGSDNNSSPSTEQTPDENLIASLRASYTDDTGYRGFALVETRLLEFANVTTGEAGVVVCSVQPCIDTPGACRVGQDFYKEGCCFGVDCPEDDTKCGENCAPVPDSCALKSSSDENCHSKDCYDCNPINGQANFWKLTNRVFDIDCMKVGTSVRKENGKPYNWAIVCGATVSGTDEEANFGLGEYGCQAFRSGADFLKGEQEAVVTSWGPCQFISLGECGCAPPNVNTFGLPLPNGPCVPGGNCTFLCSDAGTEHARNLCHAYPGDIEWWEGTNFLNWNLFGQGSVGANVDIYIKGQEQYN